jgi:undecaprenyl-diphosphatase
MNRRALMVVLLTFAWGSARAGGGPLGIDHELHRDRSGIWSPANQTAIEYGVMATEAAGALWLGNDNGVGHTFWQTIDASAIATVGAEALKYTFSRARPNQGGNPDRWFQGSCCDSFPSGQVTLQASFVTPFIVHYARRDPWIWLLEVLPLYDSLARLKNQDHWQSDVLAGWALGTGIGYWTSTFRIPLSVRVLPRGLSVGLSAHL